MDSTISRIDAVTLEGKRPRPAGKNARLGVHGDTVRLPLVRLTTAGGATGFGRCSAGEEHLRTLLGQRVEAAVDIGEGAVRPGWLLYELPLLDLAARIAGKPAYQFVQGSKAAAATLRIRSYDTSLYFDDIDLASDDEAASLIAGEAQEGWDLGHRAFKIKVGRGARHMPLEQGMARDIAIIHAVRESVGPDATVMIDANNGWNLNLTKRVLSETADDAIYWVEEAFHEDNVLYEDLKEWQAAEGLGVLIADGEGAAHPALVSWAHDGLIDVVQYDIISHGFGRWQQLGRDLEKRGIGWSPHTYGGGVGSFVTAQIAGGARELQFVEWDYAKFDAIDDTGFAIDDGWVTVPSTPGFGLELDERAFDAAVAASGITID